MQRKRKPVKRVALTPAARRMLAEGTVRPYGGAQYALARRLRNQGLFKINFSDGSYRVTDAGRAALAAQPDATMAEIAAVTPRIIHKSYGAHVGQPDRDDLTVLAVCNNINGPIAPSGCMTADDKKVTCKRCLRIVAGLPVGARLPQLSIEVVKRGTDNVVVKKLGPFASERLRDKADAGLTRQLDHERFYTRFAR